MKMQESKYVIISVMGPHAGEGEDEIFRRKSNDIKVVGRTFWFIKSRNAKPNMVQAICNYAYKKGYDVPCIFIEPSSTGSSTPTKTSNSAEMYSSDNVIWSIFPKRLSRVTGNIDGSACALVFDELRIEQGELDLWKYADFFKPSMPLRIMRGASTLCAIQRDMSRLTDSEKVKSHFRRIVAIGRLREPYGVWLR